MKNCVVTTADKDKALYQDAKNGDNIFCQSGAVPSMIGDSFLIQKLLKDILKIAETDATVLITGESGTGKEVAAEMIHRESPRKRKPFVCVNCSALPDSLVESELFGYNKGAFTGAVADQQGKFEMAGEGSIFLDEIGDMSLHAQTKILRVIENREVCRLGGKGIFSVNARLITATNKEPKHLMEEGKFREDLYYRLDVARIRMPPLRDRREDIPILARYFIHKFNLKFRRKVENFTEEAMTLMLRYHWPGNVRELKNLVEKSFINLPSREAVFMELPEPVREELTSTATLPNEERTRVVSALMETRWNKTRAAMKLRWSRMTLYRKMAKYNIIEKRNPER
ncbi:sigma-54 interaction domain-containing protein [Desulfonema magnum]|uniref:Sigma-54 interaction domain-containing protein, HTH domain-containing n=1 Tax=Desulfonema magnum TaxID=45655 RepID=A0A975GK88_9BACT|nr:sigma-54 dependent transcriptional regulator [Desulfonema magnum]QTA84255.1 Sigma-54 interaction domain-containing protein, HTH domain-containing [Desulfonema magnum]